MLTLSLLRHAKSSWDDPALEDHERPLAPRGEKAAPLIGRYMVQEKLTPDLVLCSTALRTRQTLALVLLELKTKPADIGYDDRLYLATPAAMIARLAELGSEPRHVMLVGHNPGFHALALELVRGGSKPAVARLARKFPTGALAVIDFHDTDSWTSLRPATGTLRTFTVPKDLA